MSHITIIVKRVASNSSSGVNSEVTYTPEHDSSPDDIGNNVCKLVKKMAKLEAHDTE